MVGTELAIKNVMTDDLIAMNAKLYLLLQTTNIEISYDVFCIFINLLRCGVTPEAIFLCLQHVSSHSRILKRLRKQTKLQNSNSKQQLKLANNELNIN